MWHFSTMALARQTMADSIFVYIRHSISRCSSFSKKKLFFKLQKGSLVLRQPLNSPFSISKMNDRATGYPGALTPEQNKVFNDFKSALSRRFSSPTYDEVPVSFPFQVQK
jgi:hypothetical protein